MPSIDFYMDTGSRKWGTPYLNREFFSLIGEAMSEHILLVIAERGGKLIAGALNFIGSHALYGRNWGAIEYHDNLHFETCYYQAIDFAIARKLPRVEAGAQGGAQAGARLSAAKDLQPALPRPPGPAARRGQLPRSGAARASTRSSRRLQRIRHSGRNRTSEGTNTDELRHQQHLRQDPAGRDPLPQGL